MENSTGLKSSLKTRHIVMLSLGGAIGSGLFLGSGKVIAQAGPSVLLSYILAGLTLYVVMYGVGKMVIHQDEHKVWNGRSCCSFYWGPLGAFCGLGLLGNLDGRPNCRRAGVSTFLAMLIPGVPLWVFALIVAVLGTAINLWSVRAFAETEYWLAFIKESLLF